MGKNNSLPPGFRFHPTDIELVKYYLKRKVLGKKLSLETIVEVDIYKHAPWDLPRMSCLNTGDLKWFFYCPVEKKYAVGARMNRATTHGYWKTTGRDRPVKYDEEVVGMKKTLVFHRGKPPRGERTDWVMHEYRLEEKDLADRGVVQDTYVLCAIFEKDGVGPKCGAQYGAPFKEEDWSDDDDEDANSPRTSAPSDESMLAASGACSSCVANNLCAGSSVESNELYTLPPLVNTNATVSITTEIDRYAYVASKCLDVPQISVFVDPMDVPMVVVPAPEEDWSDDYEDEDANLLRTSASSNEPMLAVSGACSSCVAKNLCAGPSVEPNELCTLPPLVDTNAAVSITTEIDRYAYVAPTCLDVSMVAVPASEGPQVPVVSDPKAESVLEALLPAQVPQVLESCDDILSGMEIFTEDDALITHDACQTTSFANDPFFWSPQVSNDDDDDDDILSILLEPFTKDNNVFCLFE